MKKKQIKKQFYSRIFPFAFELLCRFASIYRTRRMFECRMYADEMSLLFVLNVFDSVEYQPIQWPFFANPIYSIHNFRLCDMQSDAFRFEFQHNSLKRRLIVCPRHFDHLQVLLIHRRLSIDRRLIRLPTPDFHELRHEYFADTYRVKSNTWINSLDEILIQTN